MRRGGEGEHLLEFGTPGSADMRFREVRDSRITPRLLGGLRASGRGGACDLRGEVWESCRIWYHSGDIAEIQPSLVAVGREAGGL